MLPFTRWLTAVGLVLAGWLVAGQPAAAQKSTRVPLGGVKDSAGLFSERAVNQARDEIQEIKRRFGKDLVIQTFKTAPAQYEDKKPKQYASEWAQKEFAANDVDGVYVLICAKPTILEAAVGNNTRRKGVFTTTERNELVQVLLKKLRASNDAKEAGGPDADKKAQELRDQALLAGVNYVRQNMTRVQGAVPGAGAPAPGRRGGAGVEEPSGMPSWVGWVCLGLVVLMVVWLIFGVIRGFSNRGAPGYGGGGGYGPGYAGGGGGGGGFFSSMLGGLFGAAAGMYMYNHFFGGGGSAASAAPPPGAGDNYQSDVGAGSTTAGGDWSGDNGGDQGGGGGDQGGGGDWGGGGDAGGGGGGGDFGGGGGGGDWGGGGGGDFGGGGGGGDWGGGGGGGDFGGGGGGGDW